MQESKEKKGPLPKSSQRPYNQISQLFFPDVVPHDERSHQFSNCHEYLIKLPPELLIKNKDSSSLFCLLKGLPTPFVIWLYNHLNVKDSTSYSLKQDGTLCCFNANSVGPEQKSSHSYRNISSAGEAERGTMKKGWHHLHAFGPTAHSSCLCPPTQCFLHIHKKDTSSQSDTMSSRGFNLSSY